MLTDEQKAQGWIEHDGTSTAPDNWDGGPLLADDNKLYWIPPDWSWTRVIGYTVKTNI